MLGEKLNDLIQAVKEIGNWEGLCTNLGVSQGKIDALWASTPEILWTLRKQPAYTSIILQRRKSEEE